MCQIFRYDQDNQSHFCTGFSRNQLFSTGGNSFILFTSILSVECLYSTIKRNAFTQPNRSILMPQYWMCIYHSYFLINKYRRLIDPDCFLINQDCFRMNKYWGLINQYWFRMNQDWRFIDRYSFMIVKYIIHINHKWAPIGGENFPLNKNVNLLRNSSIISVRTFLPKWNKSSPAINKTLL